MFLNNIKIHDVAKADIYLEERRKNLEVLTSTQLKSHEIIFHIFSRLSLLIVKDLLEVYKMPSD